MSDCNYDLVNEFLKDKNLKENLRIVVLKFVQKSDDDLLTFIGWLQNAICIRLGTLAIENNQKTKALENCFSYMGVPSDRSFYELFDAAKTLFKDPNPVNTKWSIATLKGYVKFIEYFRKVDSELDDHYLSLFSLKDWIYKLREFVYSYEGTEWIKKLQKL